MFLGLVALGFTSVATAETPNLRPVATETPPVASNVITIDAKARMFQLFDTGAYVGPGWAERLAGDAKVSRASVYRWLSKRAALDRAAA